ncbi:Ku protein [Luteimonas sp. RD2P54]|uniref:Non-homologous end joining protein Ku n=1 Tax=Luteimonas endophytica TaxID=3042023 RepID=A0ABT6JAW3_9GAMM|nr:Ku protein [Luteimonas endophytica]MDH5823298.1 Ku protein [Luteimonas endophytica]
MARPIWTGTLSFGLLNVPVSLMSGERKTDLSFRMLDSRDNTPVRYERVNAESGDEVPWKDIVKAFEYDKGSYVVLEKSDIASATPESHETVEVETFVDAESVPLTYFEKPYVLVPGKKAEKGYVLLRETLKQTGKIGISKVVIRTREYLAAVIPRDDALLLMLMRYPQELVDPAEYRLPEGKAADYRISPKELQMATQLIESMSGEWKPEDYKNEFRARLEEVIRKKMKSKGALAETDEREFDTPEDATTNVVDFMSLLEKSIAGNKRTPAKKTGGKKTAKKAAKKTAKKAAKKTGRKAAKKTATRKAG